MPQAGGQGRVVVTGASGTVGRFMVEAALARAREVTVVCRKPPPLDLFSAPVDLLLADLGAPLSLPPAALFIHCAFSHVPGRFRGGEGADPEGFRARNLEGSLTWLRAARAAGIPQAVLLSSRAVYDGHPAGHPLPDGTEPRPTTLYGEVKAAMEAEADALQAAGFRVASLRATGVYGAPRPGAAHKWQALFADYRAERPIAPRIATELHGADLAAAAFRIEAAQGSGAFNASDLLLDRRALLQAYGAQAGIKAPLPSAADPAPVKIMTCERLAALGWQPGGRGRLEDFLASGGDI